MPPLARFENSILAPEKFGANFEFLFRAQLFLNDRPAFDQYQSVQSIDSVAPVCVAGAPFGASSFAACAWTYEQ
jgi:hypothetical protein